MSTGQPESDVPAEESAEHDAASAQEEVHAQTQGALSRSVVLVGSKASTWVLAFIMTVMMPRYLGASGFGRLYTAMSLAGIMAILVEFGLNHLVAREVSRRRQDTTRYLVNAGLLKTGLWGITLVVLGAAVRIADYPVETQIATAILALSVLFTGLGTLLLAILQADDRMRWIAASAIIEKAVFVGLGVTMLLTGRGVIAIAVVTAISTAVGLLMDLWWLHRLRQETDVHSGWAGLELRQLFVQALPFFSVLVFGAVYFRIDAVMLSLLKSADVVGYYGAAYRLFQTTYIIPEAFLFAFFPLFSRLSTRRSDALPVAAQKSLDLLALVGLPIAAGICVLSGKIVDLLYGVDYLESIAVLRVLSVAIAFMYLNGVFVHLLIATDRQKRLVISAAVAAGLNVSVNLVLIPALGALGAATATVITEMLVIAMNFAFLSRELTRRLRFGVLAKALAASLVMSGVLVVLGALNVFVLLAVGAAVYAVAIWILRAVPPEDWETLKSAIANLRNA